VNLAVFLEHLALFIRYNATAFIFNEIRLLFIRYIKQA
jgi:hypothetical protein